MIWHVMVWDLVDPAPCRTAALRGLHADQAVEFLECVQRLQHHLPNPAHKYAEDADWELYLWSETLLPLWPAIVVDLSQATIYVIGLFPAYTATPVLDTAMTSFFAPPNMAVRPRQRLGLWQFNSAWRP